MWSKKPMPVAMFDSAVPSRSTATSTSVSLVTRLTRGAGGLSRTCSGGLLQWIRPRAMGIAGPRLNARRCIRRSARFATAAAYAIRSSQCAGRSRHTVATFGAMGFAGPYVRDTDKKAIERSRARIDFGAAAALERSDRSSGKTCARDDWQNDDICVMANRRRSRPPIAHPAWRISRSISLRRRTEDADHAP